MTPPDQEAICAAVARHRDEILEWTKALIRFPSENRPPHGAEKEAQEFVLAACGKLGWETGTFAPDEAEGIQNHPSFLPGRNYDNGRKNVVAVWRGDGTGRGRSILFSGHTDVAPYEPDDWKVCRPYEPVVKGKRLYGRGSCDMKGGIAASFWGLRILAELGWRPAGDVIFETVVDEEFAGGNGTLASRLAGYNADLAVLTEPTRMEVCPACLGAFLGDLVIKGKGGMPYMGSAIPNPITGAARAIELFSAWEEKWRNENSHPLFEGPDKILNVVLWHVDSTNEGEFTQMGTPLFTKIAWITWCYPGMTEKRFLEEFERFWTTHASEDDVLKQFDMKIDRTYHYVKAWETDAGSPAVNAVTEAFRRFTGTEPPVGGAAFSCDLAIYGEAGGMPSVILGPRGDNLHASDEWVNIDDILDLTGIFALLAASWSG
ncbi:MAG: M20/M25/M40 family metallo-hydrolase [Spirochaetes bacterium]|nr:M20/M25/M40 family metallo-hydrolase [Spirochaetota bacterium]